MLTIEEREFNARLLHKLDHIIDLLEKLVNNEKNSNSN